MKLRLRLSVVTIGLLIMLFALSGMAQAASVACGMWRVVASPNPSPIGNALNADVAIAANNVWAVGSQATGSNKSNIVLQTEIQHYNGKSWSVVASPNVDVGNNALNGVVALAANNIYAVGYSTDSNYAEHSLILHYDGTAWNVVNGADTGGLTGIAAHAANDIWVVGGGTMTQHYNGTIWTAIAAPHLRAFDSLKAVTALAANDVYAVGNTNDFQTTVLTLVEHYNGTAWSIVSSPNTRQYSSLSAVTALAANNVWAVGSSSYDGGPDFTLTEHYDGTSWSIVASPNIGTGTNDLLGVAATGANNVVAVGASYSTGAPSLIERWNGTAWKVVTAPSASYPQLSGIARVPGSKQLWAVGNGNMGTLTETNC